MTTLGMGSTHPSLPASARARPLVLAIVALGVAIAAT
jgi:hypothetical protein